MGIYRKLIVDDQNELFDARGMQHREFPSDLGRVREFAQEILKTCPGEFREGNLLEQQCSELIKNGIKHGNHGDPSKNLEVWFDFRRRVRFIVQDQGAGFQNLEAWNEFFFQRQKALEDQRFDDFLGLASYRGPHSDESDGGNSLIAALEYWNGGMIYDASRTKVGVIRWYTGGSVRG